MRRAVAVATLVLAPLASASGGGPSAVMVENGGVSAPLTAEPGDVARGRSVVVDRRKGLCLLCHSGPFPEERFQGNLAPSLTGAGGRNTPAQLRARLIDSRLVAPGSLMPPYYSPTDLARVAPAFTGKTIFSAQEVEDVVAFLATLKE